MRRTGVVFAAAFLVISIDPAASAEPSGSLRDHLSTEGVPGLVDVPIAASLPDGTLEVAIDTDRDFEVFPDLRPQSSVHIAFGFLPRLTLSGRGTVADRGPATVDARDLAANVHLLLVEDGPWWPAAAVGIQDIGGGSSFFRSKYLVLSKSFFGHARVTAGYGTGPDVLEGVFGGFEFAPDSFLTLMAEHDGANLKAGARLFPFPASLEASGWPRPAVSLLWQRDGRLALGVSLRYALGSDDRGTDDLDAPYAQRAASLPDPHEQLETDVERVKQALVERGFENVRVEAYAAEAGVRLRLEYENRRYERSELDGLAIVLQSVVTHTSTAVRGLAVVLKSQDLHVFGLATEMADLVDFLDGLLPADTYATRIELSNTPDEPTGAVLARTPLESSSAWKTDLFFRPMIETRVLTEIGVFDARLDVEPEARLRLLPGMVLQAMARFPVAQTDGFGTALPEPRLVHALVHQALPLPWLPFAPGMLQLSVGLFEPQRGGVSAEAYFVLFDGHLALGGQVAGVGRTRLDQAFGVGSARLYSPFGDLALRISGGTYIDGDAGGTFDLSRLFGDTELGIFLRHTDRGSLAGVRIAIPLTFAEELKPWWIRPRLPDVFAYDQRTTVFTERNEVRNDIGRQLENGHSIEQVYYDRARLSPAYVARHLERLRASWLLP